MTVADRRTLSGGPSFALDRRLALAGVLVVAAISSATPLVVDGWWSFIGSATAAAPMPGRIALSLSCWVSVLAGLGALQRRPGNPIAGWLLASGLIGPIGFLVGSGSAVLMAVSLLAFTASATLGVAVAISFPSGRLDGRAPIALAVVAVTTVGYRIQEVVFYDPVASIPGWTAPNPFFVRADPIFLDRLGLLLNAYGIVFLVGFGWWLARRWWLLSPPARRSIAPVLAGALVFVATSVVQAAADTAGVGGDAWDAVQFVHTLSFSAIPLGFMAGLLRVRMRRFAVADLVVELGEAPEPSVLRRALAVALEDPSIEVRLWSPDDRAYLDGDGRPLASIDAEAGTRAVTLLERDGSPLAAILHDPALLEDPGLVASVASAVRLSVENARLQAAVEAQLVEVRASRGRIVEAADAERRRLERDIHDGAQQRLVALSMALGRVRSELRQGAEPRVDPGSSPAAADRAELARALDEASEDARLALAELRELARGIHPAILTQAGLGAALTSLAERASVPTEVSVDVPSRIPPAVEATAYFVVAEALTNVAKHASARAAAVSAAIDGGTLAVEVRDDGAGGADMDGGSGLRGLRDRVEALGGSFEIASAPGSGTSIRAILPVEPEPTHRS